MLPLDQVSANLALMIEMRKKHDFVKQFSMSVIGKSLIAEAESYIESREVEHRCGSSLDTIKAKSDALITRICNV